MLKHGCAVGTSAQENSYADVPATLHRLSRDVHRIQKSIHTCAIQCYMYVCQLQHACQFVHQHVMILQTIQKYKHKDTNKQIATNTNIIQIQTQDTSKHTYICNLVLHACVPVQHGCAVGTSAQKNSCIGHWYSHIGYW